MRHTRGSSALRNTIWDWPQWESWSGCRGFVESLDRKGQQSIGISEQWRICFVWRDGDVYDVEMVDRTRRAHGEDRKAARA